MVNNHGIILVAISYVCQPPTIDGVSITIVSPYLN